MFSKDVGLTEGIPAGFAPVRGRLEESKRDHEAGGGSVGEERGDEGVEKEGESRRAKVLYASTQLRNVLGGSHSSSGHLSSYNTDFQTRVPALKPLPHLLALTPLPGLKPLLDS